MNPQDFSRRIRYRPPAAWYRRVSNRLGVLLTAAGLAPQDAVTLEVRGRKSGKRGGSRCSGLPTGVRTTWWRWPGSPNGSATPEPQRGGR